MVNMDLGTCDGEASGVASALVEVRMPSGRVVRFCAHHYEINADVLLEQGAELITDIRQEALYTKV